MLSFMNAGVLLTTRTPGVIIGPIAKALGFVYNILFNFIYGFTHNCSLGIAIILFTIIVKVILTPLIFKQQKSTYKMQKLQPELNRIRMKYEKKQNDPDAQQKMAYEMQEFQKKNGISLTGGCLPLLVQLPILYALFYIFQQPNMYVDVISNLYNDIASFIVNLDTNTLVATFKDIAEAHISSKQTFDLASQADMVQLLSMFTKADWTTIFERLGENGAALSTLVAQKTSIEYFLGIDLITNPGLKFPAILIPIASGLTTFLSSKLMSKDTVQDERTASTMKTMNTIMPIMMAIFAISMPAGLGLYWIISNIIQMGQQVGIKAYLKHKDAKEEAEGGR